jgi:hypothetical protein
MPENPQPPDPSTLEGLATAWMSAEGRFASEQGSALDQEAARDLGERYDAAVNAATQEELRLAWEAARKIQSEQLMGSASWADARQVSNLLAAEYRARAGVDSE